MDKVHYTSFMKPSCPSYSKEYFEDDILFPGLHVACANNIHAHMNEHITSTNAENRRHYFPAEDIYEMMQDAFCLKRRTKACLSGVRGFFAHTRLWPHRSQSNHHFWWHCSPELLMMSSRRLAYNFDNYE